MAAITISELRVIEWGEQVSAPTNETLAVGDMSRPDASTGKLTGANGSSSTENKWQGIVASVDAGQVVTLAGDGCLVTLGTGLSAGNYGDPVYLSDTDKKLTLTSGESTTTKKVGEIEPHWIHGTVYKTLRLRKVD